MRDFLQLTQPVLIRAINVMENNRVQEKAGECSRQKKAKISVQGTSEQCECSFDPGLGKQEGNSGGIRVGLWTAC